MPIESEPDETTAILERYLADNGVGASYTAQSLTRGISAGATTADVEDFCWNVMGTIIGMVQLPKHSTSLSLQEHTTDRTVELLTAIKRLEAPLSAEGKPWSTWSGELWHELPFLGPHLRDAWSCESFDKGSAIISQMYAPCSAHISPIVSPADVGNPQKIAGWIALNLLAAKLTATEIYDMALYCIWQLREALEGHVPWCPPAPQRIALPVACHWVSIAASKLVHKEDDYGQAAAGGLLWKGKQGFCKARWTFWMDRFRQLSDDVNLDDATQGICRAAADVIDNLLGKR